MVYSIIDKINEAINTNKQIEFPYYMIWSGDFYYVLGYSDKHQKLVTFRVDRIATCPKISNIESVVLPDDFDIDEYTKSVFFMYDGKKLQLNFVATIH